MPVATPPTLTLPGLSPDRSDRATFTARSIARDDYIKNTQVPQLTLALANVFANATDAATTSGASATSAAAALASQTASGLSASSAATNQASVQTLTGQFNILYLGAKAADPTLDNAGAALVNGAFYTSTTTGNIRAYTIAGGWVTGISAVAGVSSVNGVNGAVVNIATTGANTFTAAQNHATGTAIASAATINLDTATGNRVHVTGTTAITAVTLTRGPRTVIFDGVLTLTHNATANNLPGAANITTAAGDRAVYESDGITVYCVSYIKASGVAVVAGPSGAMILLSTINATAATTVDVETTFNSTYDAYVLVVTGLTGSSNSVFLARLKLGGVYDTGANYKYFVSRADSSSTISVGHASNVDTAFDLFVPIEPAAASSYNFRINIYTPASTTKSKVLDWMGGVANGANHYQSIGVGRNVGTAAMTGIRFYPSAGTVSGTFRLYGLAN